MIKVNVNKQLDSIKLIYSFANTNEVVGQRKARCRRWSRNVQGLSRLLAAAADIINLCDRWSRDSQGP